ncbi:MAG: hypothetical protein OEW49_04165 [Nitrosopumilus sp.]|nr:hypothetical protein [Nitrosopumilus sp.]
MNDFSFNGFYSRIIYSFVIPEVISSEKNIHKQFRLKQLLKKINETASPDKNLTDFKDLVPIYDFRRNNPSGYEEKFWKLFSDVKTQDLALHLPFRMHLEKQVQRSRNWDKTKDEKYRVNVKGRLYPYGAISLQVTEYVQSKEKMSSPDIINFLKLPIMWNEKEFTIKGFFHTLRTNIIGDIIKKSQNIPIFSSGPYYIINPEIKNEGKLDYDNNWNDISLLLAMSNEARYLKKHTKEKYKNLSNRETQLIFSSPHSTVMYTPDFDRPYHGQRCLRNRISNLAEMVLIQEAFSKQYQNTFNRLINEIESQHGYKTSQIKRLFWNNVHLEEIQNMKRVFNFQDSFTNDSWIKWYTALIVSRKESFTRFTESINGVNTANLNLGNEARNSIKGVIATVKEIIEIATKIHGMTEGSGKNNSNETSENTIVD